MKVNIINNSYNIGYVNGNLKTKAANNNISPQYEEISNVYYGKDIVFKRKQQNELDVIFSKLQDKKGEDFANSAYKELVNYYGLSEVVPKELIWKEDEGRAIVGDYDFVKNEVYVYRKYFNKKSKAEQIGILAHELTHCKQTINILTTEGLTPAHYAFAIAVSDFNAHKTKYPEEYKQKVEQLKAQGIDEQTMKEASIKYQTEKTYNELMETYADILKLPKHSINSKEGLKAIEDLKAQGTANNADINEYMKNPLEQEAMQVEADIKNRYKKFKRHNLLGF